MMLMRREIGTEANFKADHHGRVRHVKAFGQVLVVVRKVTLVEPKMELCKRPSQDIDVIERPKPMSSPRTPRTVQVGRPFPKNILVNIRESSWCWTCTR